MSTNRLVEKYGQQILKDFDGLFVRQFWNLSDLARKYGFSRERARQIFRKIYGHGYKQIKMEKTIKRMEESDLCSLYLMPRIGSLLLKLEEERLGIRKLANGKFDINGHTVRFYQASATDFGGYGAKHFRPVFYNDDFEFGIVNGEGRFYVIPISEFTFEPSLQRRVLYIRATAYSMTNRGRCGTRSRDLERYREAWHLLGKGD